MPTIRPVFYSCKSPQGTIRETHPITQSVTVTTFVVSFNTYSAKSWGEVVKKKETSLQDKANVTSAIEVDLPQASVLAMTCSHLGATFCHR